MPNGEENNKYNPEYIYVPFILTTNTIAITINNYPILFYRSHRHIKL